MGVPRPLHTSCHPGSQPCRAAWPCHQDTPPCPISSLAQAIREDIFEVGAEGLTVQDLAAMLAVQPTEIVKFLFMKGIMVQMNSTLDPDTVKAVGQVSLVVSVAAAAAAGMPWRGAQCAVPTGTCFRLLQQLLLVGCWPTAFSLLLLCVAGWCSECCCELR